MSKVKIQGNASGTGVITLEAPNTNTDRTITLPDGDITLGVGIDDNATSTAITIASDESVAFSEHIDLGTGTTGGYAIKFKNASSDDGITGWIYDNNQSILELTTSDPSYALSLMTNNTERLKITSDGRGLSQFTAKAWVNYDQTGTPGMRDSHNVSSVTDSGTGIHQINFSNAMGNAFYAVNVTINGNGVSAKGFGMNEENNNTTGMARNVTYNDGTLADFKAIHTIVFGD